MPKESDDIMNDLYCTYCYLLYPNKKQYDAHLEQCRDKNTVDMSNAIEDAYYYG